MIGRWRFWSRAIEHWSTQQMQELASIKVSVQPPNEGVFRLSRWMRSILPSLYDRASVIFSPEVGGAYKVMTQSRIIATKMKT